MIRRTGEVFAALARRWIPDPFLFAALLTFLTILLGVLLGNDVSLLDMVRYWGEGFWDLLTFGMEMSLILVTGHALAHTPPVRALVNRLADLPRSGGGAAALVAATACLASLINWGLGLVVGALMALEVGRRAADRGLPVHYPLLGAAGYSGLTVWHGGLSGSAPLKVATAGHFLEAEMGRIPIQETLLSPLNLVTAAALLLAIPWICYKLSPLDAAAMTPIPEALRTRPRTEPHPQGAGTPAAALNESVIVSLLLGGMGLGYVLWRLASSGLALDLGTINLLFLSLGILLHGRPVRYVAAVNQAVRGVAGIILQFPFYAGIMGMIRGSGLVGVLAGGIVSISTLTTFPLLAFLSAGLANLFIPSGGGQWAVQGPILVEAAQALGASMPRTVMALSYGDQWTNLLQPFWALALLGITGLQARDLMGYTAVLFLFTGAIFALCLLLLPV